MVSIWDSRKNFLLCDPALFACDMGLYETRTPQHCRLNGKMFYASIIIYSGCPSHPCWAETSLIPRETCKSTIFKQTLAGIIGGNSCYEIYFFHEIFPLKYPSQIKHGIQTGQIIFQTCTWRFKGCIHISNRKNSSPIFCEMFRDRPSA